MNSYVYIKSFKNGLKVFLDETASFDEISVELNEKILASKNFFKGGKIAIDFEGRVLSADEEIKLVRIMEEAGEMTILYVIGKDEETNQNFLKAIDRPLTNYEDDISIGKIYTGNIKKGDTIKTDSSIVVMGDVEPGAELVSKGNIIILGGLYGKAIIEPDEYTDKCFIVASDITAESLVISGHKYFAKEKPKWVVRPKMVPKIAFIKDKEIVIEPISNSVLRKVSDILNAL